MELNQHSVVAAPKVLLHDHLDGGLRPAVDEQAVLTDGRELLADVEVRSLLDRHRGAVTIVRAATGPTGRAPARIAADQHDLDPGHWWVDAPGTNHHTVLLGPEGARLVAGVIADVVRGPRAPTPATGPNVVPFMARSQP